MGARPCCPQDGVPWCPSSTSAQPCPAAAALSSAEPVTAGGWRHQLMFGCEACSFRTAGRLARVPAHPAARAGTAGASWLSVRAGPQGRTDRVASGGARWTLSLEGKLRYTGKNGCVLQMFSWGRGQTALTALSTAVSPTPGSAPPPFATRAWTCPSELLSSDTHHSPGALGLARCTPSQPHLSRPLPLR